ncbi:hypothetical protein JQ557_00320 [Bradyrhizobium sp. U87765 SZCCT0131]|uniref:nucleotidyl transferase AbiEii/AbiGii toxin family protein n=1 Tax=unclassified Bradyrhizobium TaxID=2631580 RepID=UPI001BAAFE30|nr:MULTISPECIES: nucleotidyl transferase AbiEii/AbiGii toxin family protein [unclassified Bradyrhizobium]MBR1216417.1 hypothetical protein [Bradyrhizobium sp. U87765 SZCCT0131]MBR1305968.1 hypothetical protein [Bradyrhizobium sp. U87765 SZCCT0110]MBR1322335.1 hypothetical protein [Bradyrhizobium sp. U87765 SZCCT0109]
MRIARALIRQVNAEHVVIDSWSLGGGTAMMLQLDHRDSQDIDIFLPDAQLLSFLDPRLHDFQFEIAPSDYGGDGSKFLKLAFAGIGEIDFIVGQAVTAKPTMTQTVQGEDIALETVAEINCQEDLLSWRDHQAARYLRYRGGGKARPQRHCRRAERPSG